MKSHSDNSHDKTHGQEQEDPVWQLLENASRQEPGASFARDIVRKARLISEKPTGRRLFQMQSLFTAPRLVSAACACLLIIAAFQLWPSAPPSETVQPANAYGAESVSSDLAELIIEESLHAAAEDPSIYTRDEIVAMIGL